MDTYHIGRTPITSYQADSRFSYCLYVPDTIQHICVYIHGTYRDATFYRDELCDFADRNHVIIIAPLFPAGLIDPNDVDNYKFLLYHDIRFDLVLLSMIDEVHTRYKLSLERFLLGGFSGGAQFAHRFFYLHPEHLLGVSIAAPGRITLLDNSMDWWHGTRNIRTHLQQPINTEALQNVPVQLTVGAEDAHRCEQMKKLYANYQEHDIHARLDIADTNKHEWQLLKQHTINFFEQILKEQK